MNKVIHVYFVGLLFLSGLLLGCDQGNNLASDRINCPAIAVPAVTLEIYEFDTDQPISCGATALVTDGEFENEIIHPFDQSPPADNEVCDNELALSGIYERPGTYDIIVSKEGYRDWRVSGIVVVMQQDNICPRVSGVTLQVYLDKLDSLAVNQTSL